MYESIAEHYDLYYRCDLPEGGSYAEEVKKRYDEFIRTTDNNNKVVEEVLQFLASGTYYSIYSRLKKAGLEDLLNVDEVMQNTRIEILRMNFRGKCCVGKEQFYPYLVGIAMNQTNNFVKTWLPSMTRGGERTRRNVYASGNESVMEKLDGMADDLRMSPEEETIMAEYSHMVDMVLKKYIIALQESNRPPHQLLTYCYATIVPQLFKRTVNKELLRKVDVLSGRKSETPNSHYNEQENCLEGEIRRKSVFLTRWAYEAMYGLSVRFLKDEFVELYDMEKIADMSFSWGACFQENLKKDNNGTREDEVVITQRYTFEGIENWPKRITRYLMEDTDELLLKEQEITGKTVAMVEDMIR